MAGQEPVKSAIAARIRMDVLARTRVEQVQAAMALLSEEYRAVLVLSEIDGCCYETSRRICSTCRAWRTVQMTVAPRSAWNCANI